MIKTTSQRFSLLVGWRLLESLCIAWVIVGHSLGCLAFGWALLKTVYSMTVTVEHFSLAYQDAFTFLAVAAACSFSAMVAKTLAALARARQHQIGKQACCRPSRVDLFLMLVVGVAGAVQAPALFAYIGSDWAGVIVSGLLVVVSIVIVAMLPTAFRLHAPAPQHN
ncbi:hypothetical protein SJI00_20985 [Pseudomonas sp. RP23018S]|uniref:hypothetical protein n=1 Tax=Pseudomonas sp. RP23018S TaxID=3096037 RepID=UPI002ACA7BDE|nr:hypothetical protein [Pseudomonas sp. RP23018S]MDZ5605252.1 hypothetical protein [Pseudomonas sp. RP23018S]